MRRRAAAVVPAAGRGSRFGSAENKIWAEAAGRSLIEWTLSALSAHPEIETVVVAGAAEELDRLRALAERFPKVTAVVPGGDTRAESVFLALEAVPDDCDLVLVHDAARPAVSQDLIGRVLEAAGRVGAAIPGIPVWDTIKRVGEDGLVQSTPPRHQLRAVQTPQGARLDLLRAAYARAGSAAASMTDESALLERAGIPVVVVEGEEANLKVTTTSDLARVSQILSGKAAPASGLARTPGVRVGFGYDVHPFASGRELWLGGVRIPCERGLAGHSDADVVLHAVCDALLGAAGMGDIGALFPDSDPANRDRPSIEFLHEVRDRLLAARWMIEYVDIAVVAEEPRLTPYRDRMSAVIADGLQIAPTQVNIKATTSEGLGFVGRREGIACWAAATLAPA